MFMLNSVEKKTNFFTVIMAIKRCYHHHHHHYRVFMNSNNKKKQKQIQVTHVHIFCPKIGKNTQKT